MAALPQRPHDGGRSGLGTTPLIHAHFASCVEHSVTTTQACCRSPLSICSQVRSARSTSRKFWISARPITFATLPRLIAIILSIMICEIVSKPLSACGVKRIRRVARQRGEKLLDRLRYSRVSH